MQLPQAAVPAGLTQCVAAWATPGNVMQMQTTNIAQTAARRKFARFLMA